MPSISPRFRSRRWYVLAGALLVVVIAGVLATVSHPFGIGQPGGIMRRTPPTATSLAGGAARFAQAQRMINNGTVMPTTLPTSPYLSLFPYPGGSQITANRRMVAEQAATLTQAPTVAAGDGLLPVAPEGHTPGLAHGFDGLNAVQDAHLDGYEQDPPDQGLCVSSSFVVEQVNMAAVIYHANGSVAAGPYSLNGFFGDPPDAFTADQRCYFDIASQTWLSTMFALTPDGQHSYIELAARHGADPTGVWNRYRLDTSEVQIEGCPCFLDNPRLAADASGVYITGNAFNTSSLVNAQSRFLGSFIFAISKAQLESSALAPYYVEYGQLAGNGDQVALVSPAATQGAASAEYFLGTFYRSTTARYLATGNQVGVWALTGQNRLDTGGIPTLSRLVIACELYGYPPLAAQKGSVAPININDQRTQDVVYHDGLLWTTLNTVVHIAGEPVNRVGIVWLAVAPEVANGTLTRARIAGQGYLATQGAYLTFAALTVNGSGQGVMVLMLAGADYYPSAAYATFTANAAAPHFSPLSIAAAGTGPATIGTCLPQYGGACAWGDYSAAVYDVGSGDFWLATSYVAGPATPNENWATRVFAVAPSP